MNKKELNKVKIKLIAEKDFLLEQLKKEKLQIKEFSKTEIGDIIDKAYLSYEKSKTIDMSENQKKQLQAIDFALDRINKGSYGQCVRCNQKINPKRLEAIPWVTTCMRKTCITKRI